MKNLYFIYDKKRAAKRPLSTNTKTKLDLIDEYKIFTNLALSLQIYDIDFKYASIY